MSMAFLTDALEELRASGLLRRPRRTEGRAGPRAKVDGREVVVLCSNNYLALADCPEIVAGAAAALNERGAGTGASRLISGDTDLHHALEERLARFVGMPSALYLGTGYHANSGLLPALAGPGDCVVSDELDHASIVDGCRLSRARISVYRHADADAADRALSAARREGARRLFLVTETVFSMEGDLAPLRDLRASCDRHDAVMIVDEAHALGVLGPAGRGACAAVGVAPDVLVGTMGKALGCYGAFVAGPSELREILVNRCRPFVFTTAPPPAVVGACLAAVAVVAAADDRRAALAARVSRTRARLAPIVAPADTPILPIRIGDPSRTMKISDALLERGFFVQGIRPPTVPDGTSRLRLSLMATHEPADLDRAVDSIRELVELLR